MARVQTGKRKRVPDRLELGAGVWVRCRPIGVNEEEAAARLAQSAAREMVRTSDLLQEYGLDAADAPALFDIDDLDVAVGTGYFLLAVELVVLAGSEWGGFDTEDGTPAEEVAISRREAGLLFQDRIHEGVRTTFAEVFIGKALSRTVFEREEGKGSAGARPGASVPADPSAPTAANSEKDAPVAGPSTPEDSPGASDTAPS